MKSKKLELYWDKKEQKFSEQQEYALINKNKKRNLENYFKFLSDFEPAHFIPKKERLADKQFTL